MPNDVDPTLIDDDNPELSRESIVSMRPAAVVLPPYVYAGLIAGQDARASETMTLTLDRDVVDRLRSLDDDWRGRAAALLRKAVGL